MIKMLFGFQEAARFPPGAVAMSPHVRYRVETVLNDAEWTIHDVTSTRASTGANV
jgi:hypothetical protein